MQQQLQPNPAPIDGPLLYVAELAHRIGNEYAVAISLLRLAASRSSNTEAKDVMQAVVNRLSAFASAHRIMLPPTAQGLVDLADHLARLCSAVTLASLQEREMSLTLDVSTPVLLDVSRCWRIGLAVSELITNASRHAFSLDDGTIRALASEQVVCEVSDDGGASARMTPGLGTLLVDSLVAEVDGRVERRFDSHGTSVRLLFPQFPSADKELQLTTAAVSRRSSL